MAAIAVLLIMWQPSGIGDPWLSHKAVGSVPSPLLMLAYANVRAIVRLYEYCGRHCGGASVVLPCLIIALIDPRDSVPWDRL